MRRRNRWPWWRLTAVSNLEFTHARLPRYRDNKTSSSLCVPRRTNPFRGRRGRLQEFVGDARPRRRLCDRWCARIGKWTVV
ncbi:hypothetical protein C8Q74DRAFT_1306140 [Fomes fomentarius]|nr:hypothetical protein C8Q74DRAFT_1306140 [Fomes fomentarius]